MNRDELLNLLPLKQKENRYVLNYLIERPRWVNVIEIIQAHHQGCCNYAARTRVSNINAIFELTNCGWKIDSELDDNGQAKYRLIQTSIPASNQAVMGM